ncbi:MAG TPA: sigma-70 family RNA polymerase sigma factor [Patescibacteria group bacterium]|nr:sigma-70 family RNA polymerase sigma factor [Patescibacteria group bacterium]
MEKKSVTFIDSTIDGSENGKEKTDNFILTCQMGKIKTQIFKTFSQLQDPYRIHFTTEPLLFQRLTQLAKDYAILGKRKKVITEIAELPSTNYPSTIGDLRNQILEGDDMMRKMQTELLKRNENLIYPVINKMRGNLLLENDSEIYADLTQAGFIGLMVAIDKYDPSKGWEFSTYAVWWIRQKVQRLIETHCRTISIPTGKKEDIRLIQRVQKQLPEKDKNNPDMFVRVIQKMSLHPGVKKRMTSRAIRLILAIQQTEFESLDQCVGEDKQNTRLNSIPSEEIPPGQEKRDKELIEVLSATPQLTETELDVLIKYYGLIDGKACTYYDLGKQYRKSHEYMRGIHRKALRKIKCAVKDDPLFDWDLRSFI